MKIILPDKELLILTTNPGTVESLLKTLTINPLEVIVSQNGALVPEGSILCDDDEIRIIRIAHGG